MKNYKLQVTSNILKFTIVNYLSLNLFCGHHWWHLIVVIYNLPITSYLIQAYKLQFYNFTNYKWQITSYLIQAYKLQFYKLQVTNYKWQITNDK
jgi:hypothetical protein